jgi:hypothetical protein
VRLLVVLVAMSATSPRTRQRDVPAIIQRSVEVNNKDWDAAPDYDYFERDREDGGTKAYEILMILGSPYSRLVVVNGQPLSLGDQQKEQQKLDEAIAQRRSESEEKRAQRVTEYQKDRKRDHLLMEQLTRAFDFRLQGEQKIGGYDAYVLQATPRPDYQPPNIETEVLRGMVGRLWIDKATFQWVKVEARVIHAVSIEGFLAQVEPGTRFELENMPVAPGVWLAKHFSMSSRSKILFLFTHRTQAEETYFGYRKVGNPTGRTRLQ